MDNVKIEETLNKINNDIYLFDQAIPCNLAGVTNSLHNYCIDLLNAGWSTDQVNSSPIIREFVKKINYMVGL